MSPVVGKGLDRVDGRLKVTGGARYSAEWPLDRLAYGVIVQSAVARGTIRTIEDSAASAAPGVIAVLTADNAQRLPQGGRAAIQPPSGRELSLLQGREVRYNGEPIGVVVAESFEQATHAATLLRFEIEASTPAVVMEAELPNARPYTEKIMGRAPSSLRRGEVGPALATAEVKVEGTYRTPIETHNAMEPHATIAQWEGGELTLYDSTQYVYGVKRFVAKTLGLPEAAVRVIARFTGGAFGSKGSPWSHVVLAAMAAKAAGRPVKLVLSRRQMFGPVGARPYTVQTVAVGARRDGTLTAVRHTAATSTSVFEDWIEPSTLQTRMLYAIPNLETSQSLVRLNLGTPTFNRGPGESSGTFALESALDELAEKLALDPIELRRRNHPETDPEKALPWSSHSLRECYAQGAERFGWARRPAKPRSRRDEGELVGYGVASATYPTRRSPASALARVEADGGVLVQAATHELGTGTYTILAQIAADALGIPVERVRCEIGDTRFPENPISAGSMTAASSGSAVHLAALALREKIAARGADPGDAARLKALVAAGGEPLEARADSKPGPEQEKYSMHSFGAVFAEVRVDPDLGVVRVARMLGAYGVGRVLNAKTAKSQLVGGMIYGIGMALTEETHVDPRSGRYMNADLGEYLLPVHADVPDIDVLFVAENDTIINPIGAKGIGEIGTTGVAGAIANAVYNATGIRVRDLPITLDKLLG